MARAVQMNTVEQSDLIGACSHEDILELQDLFLSPGFNHLHVPTVAQGREVVAAVLAALPHLTRVAYLSLDPTALPEWGRTTSIGSLYEELAFAGALALSHSALEMFLLEQFAYDFVWIECTQELLDSSWYCYFEAKVVEFNIPHEMPILCISYE